MSFLFQSLEWALFFVIGIQAVAVIPYGIDYFYQGQVSLAMLIQTVIQTAHYSGFLLSSWLFGIPLGYGIKKIVMHNYYRHTWF